MSTRNMTFDPEEARDALLFIIEENGTDAIWSALATIYDAGIDIGPKATAIITQRKAVLQSTTP